FFHSGKDSLTVFRQPAQEWITAHTDNDTASPWLEDYRQRQAEEARIDSMLQAAKDETPSFAEAILVPKDAKQRSKRREDSISRSLDYNGKKLKPYILQLHSAYFTAKVNNDYF